MRRGRVGILVAFFLLSLFSLGQGRAMANKFEASDYIYRIKSGNCVQEPHTRIQTGFQVAGKKGIVTALHGVIGCETIIAKSGDNRVLRKLEIQQADFEHDVALLISEELADASANGLEVVNFAKEPNGDLHVIGYPLTIRGQHRMSRIAWYLFSPLQDYIPEKNLTALSRRKSPDLLIDIISLEASLQPGHSGAPLLTANGQVFGVANGGLEGGAAPISWAIPWQDVTLQEVGRTDENALAKSPLSDLSFSSTFPDLETETIDTDELWSTEDIRSYRAFTGVTYSEQDISFTLTFESGFDNDENQGSLIGTVTIQAADEEPYQEEFFFVAADDQLYELAGAYSQYDCLKRDEIPEFIVDFLEMTDEMISNPVPEELESVEAARLGTEALNGEETIRYLVSDSIPVDVTEDGTTLAEIVAADIWVAVESNQLRKFSAELTGNEDGTTSDEAFSSGMYLEIEYYDINTDATVDVPPACQDAPFASDIFSEDEIGFISSIPQSLPDNQQATLTDIFIDHNVSSSQGPGIIIQPLFEMADMVDEQLIAVVQLFDENGIPLQSYSPETGTLDGIYQAKAEFAPDEAVEIFAPYSNLSLEDGIHNLKFGSLLYDLSTETILAQSELYDFSLRQQTDADGNKTWFSDNYTGFIGLPIVDQTEVSAEEQDIVVFLSHAFEAETWAAWLADASIAEPYYSSELLEGFDEYLTDLQGEGLVEVTEFDEQSSFITDMEFIDDDTVAVEACVFMDTSFLDEAGQPLPEADQPDAGLIPFALTLERDPDLWWLITEREIDEELPCQVE